MSNLFRVQYWHDWNVGKRKERSDRYMPLLTNGDRFWGHWTVNLGLLSLQILSHGINIGTGKLNFDVFYNYFPPNHPMKAFLQPSRGFDRRRRSSSLLYLYLVTKWKGRLCLDNWSKLALWASKSYIDKKFGKVGSFQPVKQSKKWAQIWGKVCFTLALAKNAPHILPVIGQWSINWNNHVAFLVLCCVARNMESVRFMTYKTILWTCLVIH